MKKKLVLICFVLLGFVVSPLAFADTPAPTPVSDINLSPLQQGKTMFNGGLAAAFGESHAAVYLDPSFDYFLMDGLALGGELFYNQQRDGDYGHAIWGFGPRLTLFLAGTNTGLKQKGNFYPYVSSSVLFVESSLKDKVPGQNYDEALSTMQINLGGGMMYQLTRNFGVFGELNYAIDRVKYDSQWDHRGEIVNEFDFGGGVSFFMR